MDGRIRTKSQNLLRAIKDSKCHNGTLPESDYASQTDIDFIYRELSKFFCKYSKIWIFQ